jgi:hypothetical protein
LLAAGIGGRLRCHTESDESMTHVRKRRWSFRLRTLFVVVTALACWLGYESNGIHQRRKELSLITSGGGLVRYGDRRAMERPAFWTWCGEKLIREIYLPPAYTQADGERMAEIFPDALICHWPTPAPVP